MPGASDEDPPSTPQDNEFLAMLAHEFRNPLAPIRSAVEIMRVIGQKDPALEKAREMISRQVDHLSHRGDPVDGVPLWRVPADRVDHR